MVVLGLRKSCLLSIHKNTTIIKLHMKHYHNTKFCNPLSYPFLIFTSPKKTLTIKYYNFFHFLYHINNFFYYLNKKIYYSTLLSFFFSFFFSLFHIIFFYFILHQSLFTKFFLLQIRKKGLPKGMFTVNPIVL
jgi:hypothetical protein